MALNSELLAHSVSFAAQVHKDQKRKIKDIPYITHPLCVSLFISLVSEDPEIIAAGVLHDVIENCKPYGSVTHQTLTELFGSRIADLVSDVSENDKSLPWIERKERALNHLRKMSQDSLLIKTADVLHNITELNADIRACGVTVFNVFNATQEQTLERYNRLITILHEVWPENPLLDALDQQHHLLQSLTE